MLIDCDTCTARGLACDGCIVPTLLATATSDEGREEEQRAPLPLDEGEQRAPTPCDEGTPVRALDEDEQRALRVLADSGMIPTAPVVALYEKSAGRAA